MNCGFVGGIIFPLLTMGMVAGAVMHMNYPGVPLGLCMGSFMISVACAVVPMPFTFTVLSATVFFFGLEQTVPIFVASFVSFLLLCGTGLMKRLVNGSRSGGDANAAADNKNKNKDGQSMSDGTQEQQQQQRERVSQQQKEQQQQQAEDFALKQYLGNKRSSTANTQQHA